MFIQRWRGCFVALCTVLLLACGGGDEFDDTDELDDVFDPVGDNNALNLDGRNDYVREAVGIASPSPLDVPTFTVEAWVRPTELRTMSIMSDGAYLLATEVDPTKANGGFGVEWIIFNSDGSDSSLLEFRDIELNQWNHLAGVYDAATNVCRIAINGIVTVHPNCADTPDTGLDNLFGFGTVFAGDAAGEGAELVELFEGQIDEARVSDTARYPTNFTPPDDLTADAATLGLWHFDEASGSTEFTDSAADHDLTGLNGAVIVQGFRP